MKKYLNSLIYHFLYLLGEGFSNTELPIKVLLKHIFIQKVCRINSHVSWPVHWTSKIQCPEKIHRGTRNPGLSVGCYLDGRNGIILGKNVWIGPKVSIISMNHDPNNHYKYIKTNPILIGDNCWLGTGVIVLPGVRLGNHVVCAAGSVITKSFPEDNILLGGIPARVKKHLPPYENG